MSGYHIIGHWILCDIAENFRVNSSEAKWMYWKAQQDIAVFIMAASCF